MLLEIKNLTKAFDGQVVINNFDFTINSGEIVVLVGRSGTGKTTFLRIINNLEKTDGGNVAIKDSVLVEDGHYVNRESQKAYQNRIGMVFQDYQLFPNFNVIENLMEAPLAHGVDSKTNIKKQAEELLSSMGLLDKAYVKPSTLSGGQKQRVAIARAMMLNPDILCFDEPTSALDRESAEDIGKLIQSIAARGTGILIVTHDTAFGEKYGTRLVSSTEFK